MLSQHGPCVPPHLHVSAHPAVPILLPTRSKLDLNRQVQIEPAATGLKGTIPESWAGMTELKTL
jgi:hypothetical protein